MGPLALSRVASLVLQPAYGQVRVPDELKKRAIEDQDCRTQRTSHASCGDGGGVLGS